MKLEEVDPAARFPDERFSPLEHSGDVDCFVCGHKVNVLVACTFLCSAGPTAWVHRGCISMPPDHLWLIYSFNVLGAVANITSAPDAVKRYLRTATPVPLGT